MNRTSHGPRRALSRYLRDIRGFPLLSRQDEQRLAELLERGDPEALDSLVEGNLGFVVRVAMDYRSLGLPFEDLLNEGNLGLIEAARRYDPSKGTKFITYAMWWIRKAILQALADRSHVVRLPQQRRQRVFALRKTEAGLRHQFGRPPTREELAARLSISPAEVDGLRRLGQSAVSLDRTVGEDDAATLTDLLEDEDATAEERLLSTEAESLVMQAFARLTQREQAVLAWRFGLGGETPLTLQDAGARLGISRERVRQIELQARRRLRRMLTRGGLLSSPGPG